MQRGFTHLIMYILLFISFAGYILYKNQSPKSIQPQTSTVPVHTSTSPANATSSTTFSTKPQISPTPIPSPTPVFSSRVKLESVSPSVASSGEEVKLFGSGFGTLIGKVHLYNQFLGPSTVFANITPNRWTDTEIKITIPPALGDQTIDVEAIHFDGTKSNKASFQVKKGQPRMDSISPSNAQPLQSITISGNEFGTTSSTVNIYKTTGPDITTPFTKCENQSWDDNSIRCTLPSNVNNGSEYGIEIVTSDNRKSSFKYYKVGN